MVVETDDKEERTGETPETPMADSALIGWLGAIHAEILAQRVEMREMREETRAEMREMRSEMREYREETRVEMREMREETRAEIREARVETRESREETRVETRESREETRAETRESREETRAEIRELSSRTGRLEERVTRIEAGIEAERGQKNRLIMWLGIGIGALIGAGGVVVGVIGLLN